MLRLRRCILPSPSASPISPLHRLLSVAASAVSPNPSFATEDYLVDTCGLTRAQALKACTKISHLKSPSKPDAVLAFLADLGLSGAEVAAVVAKDPSFLCAKVAKTLAPNLAGLAGLGLSSSEVARLVSAAPRQFRVASIVSKVQYYLPLFGSSETLLRAFKCNTSLLTRSLDKVVKPNVSILHECGLGVCDIAKVGLVMPVMFCSSPDHVWAMVALVEGLGVPRGSPMFRYALHAVAFLDKERIDARMECLKKTFRWSDADVSIAVPNSPGLLIKSKELLQHKAEFFFYEVGLEPAYIARRPAVINYSLEGRLRPRYQVLKCLKENGLINCDRDYYKAVSLTEKVFMARYICPHKEAAPHLAENYATACSQGWAM